jgi:hypothetical protein
MIAALAEFWLFCQSAQYRFAAMRAVAWVKSFAVYRQNARARRHIARFRA